jgi:hypothetical protein
MAPLQLNDINEDASKPKQKRRRVPLKKEPKNPEEAQEVLSEKVSCRFLFFSFSYRSQLNFVFNFYRLYNGKRSVPMCFQNFKPWSKIQTKTIKMA